MIRKEPFSYATLKLLTTVTGHNLQSPKSPQSPRFFNGKYPSPNAYERFLSQVVSWIIMWVDELGGIRKKEGRKEGWME